MTIEKLLNILIRCGILTPLEGQICLMTGGELPDDIFERMKKFEEEETL